MKYMIKEIAAAVVLIAILVAVILNIRYLGNVCTSMEKQIQLCRDMVYEEDWDSARQYAESASKEWLGHIVYVDSLLRSAEADSIGDNLVQLLLVIDENDKNSALGNCVAIIEHIDTIMRTERISLETIF